MPRILLFLCLLELSSAFLSTPQLLGSTGNALRNVEKLGRRACPVSELSMVARRGMRRAPGPYDASAEKRNGRVGKLVQNNIAQILREPYSIKVQGGKVRAELLAAASVVEVEMSRDNRVAKVMISAQDARECKAVVKWLQENNKALRYSLAQRISYIKNVPELRFKEANLPQAMSLMALLDEVANERKAKEAKVQAAMASQPQGPATSEEEEGARAVAEGMSRELEKAQGADGVEGVELHSQPSVFSMSK
mmetsp:Transcript_48342/g.75493  ORF Transcript_48342/g.75493 Transcript_48342/m.75493 type:complete len:251 (-) Transcript_48342:129-881(-)